MRLRVLGAAVTGILLNPSASASFVSQASRIHRGRRGCDRSRSMTSHAAGRVRRLIVDTDLGLDDLVAMAILRLQQCINQNPSLQLKPGAGTREREYTNFRLSGVILTPGVSRATLENAELLRRLLPPDTPVYTSETEDGAWNEAVKPKWWGRTADRVTSFLSSLPPLEAKDTQAKENGRTDNISAEQFVAANIDEQDVDFLCMAPLSTVARALYLRKKDNNSPSATFYIMGGMRSDSRETKRGESTAPFGYKDALTETPTDQTDKEKDAFGEFNFALDVKSAREVLSSVEARIIPLEACTLVPQSLRSEPASATLSSMLKDVDVQNHDRDEEIVNCNDDAATKELRAAQSALLGLLNEFGTTETQWDSISAAIYCNAFNSSWTGHESSAQNDASPAQGVDPAKLVISELGELTFPGCGEPDEVAAGEDAPRRRAHRVYPAFTTEDEVTFLRYVSSLLDLK